MDPELVQYTTQHLFQAMAFGVVNNIIGSSLVDYTAFFTILNRNILDIPSNCVVWKISEEEGWQFHYLHGHAFGEKATPFSADVLASLLQNIQQHHIDLRCHFRHFLIRRVDDTMILHSDTPSEVPVEHRRTPRKDAALALAIFKKVCTRAQVPIQETKTRECEDSSLFDGYCFDWPNRRIGYPRDKARKLYDYIDQILRIADKFATRHQNCEWNRTTEVEFEEKAHSRSMEINEKVSLTGFQNDSGQGAFTVGYHSKHVPTLFKLLESVVGQLEYATFVWFYYRPLILPIRRCYQHLPRNKNYVPVITQEAYKALESF